MSWNNLKFQYQFPDCIHFDLTNAQGRARRCLLHVQMDFECSKKFGDRVYNDIFCLLCSVLAETNILCNWRNGVSIFYCWIVWSRFSLLQEFHFALFDPHGICPFPFSGRFNFITGFGLRSTFCFTLYAPIIFPVSIIVSSSISHNLFTLSWNVFCDKWLFEISNSISMLENSLSKAAISRDYWKHIFCNLKVSYSTLLLDGPSSTEFWSWLFS